MMNHINTVAGECSDEVQVQKPTTGHAFPVLETALLTGCQDRHYAFGLATALAQQGVHIEVIGSDEIDSPELHTTSNIRFLKFRGTQASNASLSWKISNLLIYYAKLIRHVTRSKPGTLHILWNYKLEYFDRTILMMYYKALRKRVALTAHNVNQAKRDSNDSWLNRFTLKIQYRLCDHIFVHTQKMREELCRDFGVAEEAVTVIPYPINNAFADTELTPPAAKQRLGLGAEDRAILFFGRIVPYKGLEHLLQALRPLVEEKQANYKLIIAGEPKKGCEEYLREIEKSIERDFAPGQVILQMQFIPDDELELYFKGADLLVLPYKDIFQSGVLFLSYSFGLPVVATDVGSFREEIVEGSTGFLCEPGKPTSLAAAIKAYFESDLYKNLSCRREELKHFANAHHSWNEVAELTCRAYAKSLR